MTKKCVGCGSVLQTNNQNKEGYINKKVYEKALYCERCFKITHYGEANVLDKSIDKDTLINKINKENKKVLYLIDITCVNMDSLEILKKIKTEIYIILTKKDLLPKSVKNFKLKKYIQETFGNYITFVVSSEKMDGIEELYNTLKKENSDFYILGNTNSGKSSLINSFLKLKGKEQKITTSNMPNTTMDFIVVEFDEFKIIDTPGFSSENSLCETIVYKDFKKLLPKKEIKPKIHVLKPDFMILIDNLLRIENISNTPITLIFYISNEIKLKKMKQIRNNELKNLESEVYEVNSDIDLVIDGIGFIKVIGESNLRIFKKTSNIISKRAKMI